MRTVDLLKLALKNVKNSRITGFLCVISICIGITSVSLIYEIGAGASDVINGELKQLGSNATMLQSDNDIFDESDVELIKKSDEIYGAMPYAFEIGGVYAKTMRHDALILGIDSDFPKIFNVEYLYGAKIGEEETAFKGNQVIVDDTFANELYCRTNIVGKILQISVGGVVSEYEVVSIVKSPKAGIENIIGQSLPAIVYIPYTTINEEYGENKIAGVAITCMENADYSGVKEKLSHSLEMKNAGAEYKFENISNYTDMVKKISGIITVMLSCIAGISVIVGGIGIMSSMISGVENRKSEIGIYMALGINKADILKMYVCESFIISAAGGIFGIGLSSLIVFLINIAGITAIRVQWQSILLCFMGSVLCGIIFGYLPAKKAAEMNPINAIRWE